ncbi:S1 family peptidase [Alsobacter sp. SYSU M60028]|uniref:S1 family peptidase n=1 Tax=Alsobacter ponti TaxID=2962936 RepID=A0ABT1L8F2_9HYPH|nr:S1 family peptidase [Alsobacter ponti]MCP8937787.1 S1 family peptidase [Alsobacter ponti]
MRAMGRLAAALAFATGAGGAALAVVKGRDAPELARHAVMVLDDRGGFCTGVVVAPDVVMTAGHCIAGAKAWRIHFRDAAGAPTMLEPSGVALHPGYNGQAVQNRRQSIDLALVRLPAPLPAPFAPVALAASDASGGKLSFAGRTLGVGGYGLAAEGEPRTGGRFRLAELGVVEPYGPSRILVWLSDPSSKPGAGACQGDSGGPVFGDGGEVVAVTVWAEGVGKAKCGGLTQALLVAPQRGWIDSVLAKWR